MIESFGAAEFLPIFRDSEVWIAIRDGDPSARGLFRRHYSYRPYADGRDPELFVGPGEKLVLMTRDGRGLFVWRRFRCDTGEGKPAQEGVNCAVFRNEGTGILSSRLVAAAREVAWARWPGERLYTFVNPRRVASTNPGWCFICDGWQPCGYTKWNRLRILERLP
jgi:hypothetical protein